ncbi:MAG TPA: LptF/LptG family permease [Chlamydiales bacterium]|nr:LptF/LptG family permease [Chlamydiales bacterium]
MKIWFRHILWQLTKTFLFLLVCLFAIYVVVDLSVHGVRFLSSGHTTFAEVSLYYFRTLAVLLDLFLTLTFLLATMRVLFDLNGHREIVALQMAGLSKKKLLVPFFVFAAFLSSLCYINSQWFSPDAQDVADAFMIAHRPQKKSKADKIHVYSISLEDDSELVYQSFDKAKKELFDVYWIRNPNDIWHMKNLRVDPLQGQFVNHLTRNSKKQLEKSESFTLRDFPELPWNEEATLQKFVPFENRPIATLCSQAIIDSAERRSILTHLSYKLLVPLMPFLVLFAIGPISTQFSRNRPVFLIAAFSLFGFISLKVILDGMLILGENQVLPAIVAIWGPIALVLAFSLPSFIKMR